MSTVKFSKTRRGGDALAYEGYGYVRKHGQPNVWRCRKQTICQATVRYNVDGSVTPCGLLRHLHAPDEDPNAEPEPEDSVNLDDFPLGIENVVERTPTPVKTVPVRRKRAHTECSLGTPVPISLRPRASGTHVNGSIASLENGLPYEEHHPIDRIRPTGSAYVSTKKEAISMAPALNASVSAHPEPCSSRQYLANVPVSTVDEERFLHYVGGVLGSVELVYKKRYMQSIRCAIAKLDLEIAELPEHEY